MYPIIYVPGQSTTAPEFSGTKPKRWFDDGLMGQCLFKEARAGSGEDWAEKFSQELARRLDLPCAQYELAQSTNAAGQPALGIATPNFVPGDHALFHGEDLIGNLRPEFARSVDESRQGRTALYNVDLVFDTLERYQVGLPGNWRVPDAVESATDLFVGYLLLDGLVGNTDRHQQNWAVLQRQAPDLGPRLILAPLFDTASCLGRELSDAERARRLESRDSQFEPEGYADRARSPFYTATEPRVRLSPIEAFRAAATLRPRAAKGWIELMASIGPVDITEVLDQFPGDRLSLPSREFIRRFVAHNHAAIQRIGADLS
jgi:hypothetical protein